MHGACFKREDYMFSHSLSDQASQITSCIKVFPFWKKIMLTAFSLRMTLFFPSIRTLFFQWSCHVCTFYQRGLCSYGSRCRYEHVKLSRPVSNNPLPPLPRPSVVALNSSPDTSRAEESSSNTHTQSAWQLTEGKANLGPRFLEEDDEKDVEEIELPTSNDLSEIPICAFAAAGICPRGDNCPQIHECDNHRQQCERNQKKLEALRKSQDIECSVCLERVLSKPTVAERKFGLMSGRDHPFCVGCIRGWRSGSHAPGMDIDTVVRACPVYRVTSHFIVPSVVWYSSSEEKEDIINGCKNKLRCRCISVCGDVDCKYFDYGNGTCPFGTSCFYKDIGLRSLVLLNLEAHLLCQHGHLKLFDRIFNLAGLSKIG
ncbi:hypothetical protein CY35_14G105600 [Sphagnum magellanicum]|nr:hypothetical protein CY35_14G105600 [Sphagnum magellanicum]